MPVSHGRFVSLDGALLRLLRAEAQVTQDAPHLRLAKAHAVQALDDGTHALERPQLRTKAMLGGALQQRRPHAGQLRRIQLGWPPTLGYGTQRIEATLIKQRLPCVHGLSRHAHCFGYFRRALACAQHSPGVYSFLGRFTQSLSHHVLILQYGYRELDSNGAI